MHRLERDFAPSTSITISISYMHPLPVARIWPIAQALIHIDTPRVVQVIPHSRKCWSLAITSMNAAGCFCINV